MIYHITTWTNSGPASHKHSRHSIGPVAKSQSAMLSSKPMMQITASIDSKPHSTRSARPSASGPLDQYRSARVACPIESVGEVRNSHGMVSVAAVARSLSITLKCSSISRNSSVSKLTPQPPSLLILSNNVIVIQGSYCRHHWCRRRSWQSVSIRLVQLSQKTSESHAQILTFIRVTRCECRSQ